MALRTGFVAVLLLFLAAPLWAQDLPVDQQLPPVAAPTRHIEVGELPVLDTTPKFDAAAATEAYLARVGGAERTKSDAYTNGGYFWGAVNFLWGLLAAGFLLWTQLSARIRDWAAEKTRGAYAQATAYGVIYVATMTAAVFPLSLYEGYYREQAYGLSNQTIWGWLGDFSKGFALALVAGALILPVLYAAIRKTGRAWWLWGAGIVIAFSIFVALIAPVFIAPLFNKYTPLPDSAMQENILSLARANDIPAQTIWVADESRQTKRISANVSGFLGTTRISLNDNLLNQGTPDEVLAVLGHEMGHYVMGHVLKGILLNALVTLAGFALVGLGFSFVTGCFGRRWQVAGPGDIAGLPLLVALMSIFMFVATPLTNSISRNMESEADLFGINAVRKPDAFSTLVLKLANYRKLDPGPWEEQLLYDHPSGRARIAMMMRWKKEHLRDLDIRDSLNGNPR